MRKNQVIKMIGEENWEKFCDWMRGQTMGIYPDGETNFYDHDVEAFVYKMKRDYDRQKDPLAWD